MTDNRSITELVTRARNGDQRAWDELVERYASLVWSICRGYQLRTTDVDDVHQIVWLQLVSQLGKIRDPAALPGWLATTTRRECVRVLRAARGPHAAGYVPDAETIPDQQAGVAEQELLVAERHAALREALARLPPCCQRLIGKLIEDPPLTYAQISASLGISVGSIGPLRGRCLDKLRADPAIAALIDADVEAAGSKTPARLAFGQRPIRRLGNVGHGGQPPHRFRRATPRSHKGDFPWSSGSART